MSKEELTLLTQYLKNSNKDTCSNNEFREPPGINEAQELLLRCFSETLFVLEVPTINSASDLHGHFISLLR